MPNKESPLEPFVKPIGDALLFMPRKGLETGKQLIKDAMLFPFRLAKEAVKKTANGVVLLVKNIPVLPGPVSNIGMLEQEVSSLKQKAVAGRLFADLNFTRKKLEDSLNG